MKNPNFKPMRMRWGFVIAMAARDLDTVPPDMTPSLLCVWARREQDLFPQGLSLEDAGWILANPDASTDGEP